jgi:hypothetical protein
MVVRKQRETETERKVGVWFQYPLSTCSNKAPLLRVSNTPHTLLAPPVGDQVFNS